MYKISIVGDGNSGKTTFIHNLSLEEEPTLTSGIHLYKLYTNRGLIKLKIYDVVETEEEQRCYLESNIIIVMCNLSSPNPFSSLNKWIDGATEDTLIVICGNRYDGTKVVKIPKTPYPFLLINSKNDNKELILNIIRGLKNNENLMLI